MVYLKVNFTLTTSLIANECYPSICISVKPNENNYSFVNADNFVKSKDVTDIRHPLYASPIELDADE